MEFIHQLRQGLANRKDLIKYELQSAQALDKMQINVLRPNWPVAYEKFYKEIEYIKITVPRFFQILPLKDLQILQDRYLLFSYIRDEKICFDMHSLNSAQEWDIICLRNHFVITKTLASYLTNKIWAWVDRGREIWKPEYYDSSLIQ